MIFELLVAPDLRFLTCASDAKAAQAALIKKSKGVRPNRVKSIYSLGHSLILQDIVWFDDPSHFPPYFSVTDLDLDLVCDPTPQVLEHFEYSFHSPH